MSRILVAIAVLLLSGCVTATPVVVTTVAPTTEREFTPKIGEVATAGTGDTLFQIKDRQSFDSIRFRRNGIIVYTTENVGTKIVRAVSAETDDEFVARTTKNGRPAYCGVAKVEIITTPSFRGSPPVTSDWCFFVNNNNEIALSDGTTMMDTPGAIVSVRGEYDIERKPYFSGNSAEKKAFLLGISGNKIHVRYQEIGGNNQAPSVDNSLFYEAVGGTKIKISGAYIEVLSLSANSLKYKVLDGQLSQASK